MNKAIYLLLFALSLIVLKTPGFAAGPEIWKSGCAYIVGKQVKADTTCTVKIYATATSATEVWEWDNGNHTVVKMSDKGILLNGQQAEKYDGTQVIDVEEPTCYRIKNTSKIYCWGT